MKATQNLSDNATKLLMVCMAASILAVYWLANGLVIVMSPSIAPTVLWKIEGKPVKDEYVSFEFQHELINKSPFLMTKRIGCYEGEALQRKAGFNFYCQGRYLGFAKSDSVDGRQMPLFSWEGGTVPAGKVFVVGSHADSFDSRYWGFVALDELQRLKALL